MMKASNGRDPWIWLPRAAYPDRQTTYYSALAPQVRDGHYTAAELERTYSFGQAVRSVSLRFSGDTFFVLRLNGQHLASGPASAGGDFLNNEKPRPTHYASVLCVSAADGQEAFADGILRFQAAVRMMPERICEYSRGQGGFFLTASVTFADGTETTLATDESWQIRCLPAYVLPGVYDGRKPAGDFMNAERTGDDRLCTDAPIPPCTEELLVPSGGETVLVPAGGELHTELPFDRIYAGYVVLQAETAGLLEVVLHCCETEEEGSEERCVFTESAAYRGFALHSAGTLRIDAVNRSGSDAVLHPALLTSFYPVTQRARTVTSDSALNLVTEVCAHTLKYCRQTLHLDSPRHCEPLACTGDYYIETLMTAFTYGDERLAAFDVRRTAELLFHNDGRMFHTTYSLIWVQMLWDVYCLTGEKDLLSDCEGALALLFRRFSSYFGENGLIETPPDYMFIDWLNPDGISTHHPPKALGQTCLNLFYFGAQRTAEKIYAVLEMPGKADACRDAAEAVRTAILGNLYDAERGLFFEGLNTPTPEYLLAHFMPQNTGKRYYRMHANILAAYFGILEKEVCAGLLDRILQMPELGPVQPYFQHFLLEAVYRNGLREKWTLPLLAQWKEPCESCPKGLPEGFYKPEPTYRFDHSHAWGGTPAYALPLALSGLSILEPGYRKIRLEPSLLGLDSASVEIPTPFGMIRISMQSGGTRSFRIPEGIEAEIC